ncbi:unnamed protein product [Parajaminaea phylloscopi]
MWPSRPLLAGRYISLRTPSQIHAASITVGTEQVFSKGMSRRSTRVTSTPVQPYTSKDVKTVWGPPPRKATTSGNDADGESLSPLMERPRPSQGIDEQTSWSSQRSTSSRHTATLPPDYHASDADPPKYTIKKTESAAVAPRVASAGHSLISSTVRGSPGPPRTVSVSATASAGATAAAGFAGYGESGTSTDYARSSVAVQGQPTSTRPSDKGVHSLQTAQAGQRSKQQPAVADCELDADATSCLATVSLGD